METQCRDDCLEIGRALLRTREEADRFVQQVMEVAEVLWPSDDRREPKDCDAGVRDGAA